MATDVPAYPMSGIIFVIFGAVETAVVTAVTATGAGVGASVAIVVGVTRGTEDGGMLSSTSV